MFGAGRLGQGLKRIRVKACRDPRRVIKLLPTVEMALELGDFGGQMRALSGWKFRRRKSKEGFTDLLPAVKPMEKPGQPRKLRLNWA